MRNAFYILIISLSILGNKNVLGQIIYNWNTWPAGSLSGNISSSGNNMAVSITTVGTTTWTAGSPTYTTGNVSQGTGLLLNTNWGDLVSSITFSASFATALCGPVTFNIIDINQNPSCALSSNRFKDSIIISGTNTIGTIIYPSSITSSCASNTISSSRRIGGASSCGGGTTTVTFSTANVKSIKIEYLSGRSLIHVPSGACTNTVSSNSVNPRDQLITIGSITGCGVLPVTLLDYKVECKSDVPQISWSTASEQNNNFFSIERSIDGEVFHTIGIVNSLGNSSMIQSYSYVDQNPLQGFTYYRISQTDLNNTVANFEIKPYTKNCSDIPFDIVALSNPFENTLSLNLKYNTSSIITLFIHDNLGQIVKTIFDNKIMEGETSKISINTNDLSQSVYYLSGKVNNEPFSLKLIKIKN